MAADAPEASPAVRRAVRDALILFYQATARVYRELDRAEKLGVRDDWVFQEAMQELRACLDPLTIAIDPELREDAPSA